MKFLEDYLKAEERVKEVENLLKEESTIAGVALTAAMFEINGNLHNNEELIENLVSTNMIQNGKVFLNFFPENENGERIETLQIVYSLSDKEAVVVEKHMLGADGSYTFDGEVEGFDHITDLVKAALR